MISISKLILLCFVVSLCISSEIFYPALHPLIEFKGRYYIDNGIGGNIRSEKGEEEENIRSQEFSEKLDLYINKTDQNAQSGIRFDWPCSSINFCFVDASTIYINLKDSFGIYNVSFDNGETSLIEPGKSDKVKIYETKKPENSTICGSLYKITEDHYGPLGTYHDALFIGVILQGENPSLVPQSTKDEALNSNTKNKKKLTLEFVGDSITSAFGVMTNPSWFCFFNMKHIQNCLESWAVHLSNMLDADYRIIAESGKGVYKNAFGVPAPVMPEIYTKITSNSKKQTYSYQDGYEPDAIIIKLGDNDFSNPIAPSEKVFRYSYEKMLNSIVSLVSQSLGKYPKIINICSYDIAPNVCKLVEKAVFSFSFAYKESYYIEVPKGTIGKESMGCAGHFNVRGQRKLAESVEEGVRGILGLE